MFFSKLNSTKLARALACGLIASAIAAPAAAAAPADNVVVTSSEQQSAPVSDLRSPDSSQPVVRTEDLRSPDAAVAHVPEPVAVSASETSGFDWSTAGISVAALSGLLIITIAAFGAVRHGRRPVAR